MTLLLDTSLLIAMERDEVDVDDVLREDDGVVSVITVSELLHGVFRARSPVRTRRRVLVDGLLRRFPSISITEDVARLHAELGAELAAAGMTVASHDLWIGCTALIHNAGVATRDRRSFERIPGLHVRAA